MALFGFLTFLFAGFTLINRILEGQLLSSVDVATLNNVLLFREIKILDVIPLWIPNLSFITEGLPRLMKWDYAFFGGDMGILTYFLYSASGMLAFFLFITMASVAYSVIKR